MKKLTNIKLVQQEKLWIIIYFIQLKLLKESVEPTIFLVGSIKQNPYYYKITGPYCFIKAPYPWIAQKKYNDFYQGKHGAYLLGFKDDISRISSLVSEDIRDLIKQIETGEIQVDFIN